MKNCKRSADWKCVDRWRSSDRDPVYDKYKDKKFDIVGVSFDVKQENWENAVKTLELPWHQMSDLKGWDSQAAEKYRVNAIPFTILFNPKGKIVATDLRGKALADKMKEIMGF